MSGEGGMIRFEGRLEGHAGGSFVVVPQEVCARLGGRARIPVHGTLNGLTFRSSTMPTGDGGHLLGFRQDQRGAAGVEVGDVVTIELARDYQERTVEVPPDLALVLEREPQLRTAFDSLSYTARRERAEAVATARRPETRARRLERLLEELRRI